jgi:hypothetical protein
MWNALTLPAVRSMNTRQHRRIIRASLLLVAAIVLVTTTSCRRRRSYPIGVVADFQIGCVRQLWPGSPRAPYDLREAYCECILQRAQQRWTVAEFDQLRYALEEGGTRALPSEFITMMNRCQNDLRRGRLAVDD